MQSYLQTPLLALIFSTLIFVGCSSQPHIKAPSADPFGERYAQSQFEQLLAQARATSDKSKQSQLFLEAARSSLDSGLYAQAQYAMDSVNEEFLRGELYQNYALSQIELGVQLGDVPRLQRYESRLNLRQTLRTSLSEQGRIVRLLSTAFSLMDEPLKAAVLLSDYEGVFGIQESPMLNEEIWLMLQRSSTEELTQYQYQGNYPNTIAWLKLAKQMKLSQASIDQQYLALEQWLNRHPSHPGAMALPLELELLSQLPETSPKEIILALPLSGKFERAGNAVRDGFLANYYLQSSSEKNVVVRTFDTAANTINTLYENLEEHSSLNNNTLIIGPLIKDALDELINYGDINTPTLALNIPEHDLGHPNLFVFGLNPEDELNQIAQKMIESDLTRIGVIAPENARGKRLAETFLYAVNSLGGHVVSQKHYENQKQLASTVSDLLSTSRSTERARKIRSVTGVRIESEPRRRRDLDAILMLADNRTAKQIKPMLAFNFASDIPVFANSQIHNTGNEDANNDLNGIRFVDIPWMFARTAPLRSKIDTLLTSDAKQYARFFALGADAYTLAPRLQLLIDIENTHVQGQTGLLSVTPQGRVTRKLQWAVYKKGRAQTIN